MNQLIWVVCVLAAPQAALRGAESPSATPPAASAPPSATRGFSGKVVETMNAASYTYVRVDTGAEKLWAAAPQCVIKIGDTVTIGEAMPMPNYHSKTLNRDFDLVYFTGSLGVGGLAPAIIKPDGGLPENHPPIGGALTKPKVDFSGLKKPAGGTTVAEIFAAQTKLKGKAITVRGRVVKFNAMILGKNWLHIQDGTGSPGSNDLTITTASTAKIGDTVLVTGAVSLNRDFGSGYKYALIMEDAKVIVE